MKRARSSGLAAGPSGALTHSATIQYPLARCPGCSKPVYPYSQVAVTAAVLDTGGWKQMLHIPVRCRDTGACPWGGKRIWHNFISESKTEHFWTWPTEQELGVFFLWSDWGVTTAWLRQMARRVVHHFASFAGEAAVHRAEAAFTGSAGMVPAKAGAKLFRAWIVWRAIIRMEEHGLALESVYPGPRGANLLEDLEVLLDGIWEWYPEHMLAKRVACCRAAGADLSKLVVDGNQKLCRRVCGRPVAEISESKALGMCTVTPCSCKPAFKQRRCRQHAASAPPSDRGPEQSEVITGHRRLRVVHGAAIEGEPYQVQLKSKDSLDDSRVSGRWVGAECATAGQLYDYWSSWERGCYLPKASSPADLGSTQCKTHKEGMKGFRKLVKQGRMCGWLFAVTSTGLIVHAKEFIGGGKHIAALFSHRRAPATHSGARGDSAR